MKHLQLKQWKNTTIIYCIASLIGGFLAVIVMITLLFSFSKGLLIDSLLSMVPKKPLQGMNILTFGIDNTNHIHRSDTIIVLHLDTEKNRIGVISIPRDTRVNMGKHGFTKINHAYANGGIKLLKKTVSDFLNIPIDHHVKINLNGVKAIVDQVGGVPVYVKKNLHYQDSAGQLNINLEKGHQVLSGQIATDYIRFRHDRDGDIGRIRRQQNFLRQLTKKIMGSGNILTSTKLIKKLSKSITTDLSFREIASLIQQFNTAFQTNNIHTNSIPGAVTLIKNVSYWRPDIIGMDKVINTTLFGFNAQGRPKQVLTKIHSAPQKIITPDKSASRDSRRKISLSEATRISQQGSIKDLETKQKLKNKIKIEVLNGDGTPGLAKKFSLLIKKQGYHVTRYDNSQAFTYNETLLVDWKGDIQNTLILAELLSVEPSNIIVYDRPNKPLDVTIVVGHDWHQLLNKLNPSQTQPISKKEEVKHERT